MIYLVPVFIAIIMRHYGLAYREDIGRALAEIVLAFTLFADMLKIRFSLLVQYHRLPLSNAFLAFFGYGIVLWYTLPNELFSLLPSLLLISSYDFRGCKEMWRSTLIPPRIKQFLSIDGILRSLLVAFVLSPVFQLDWTSIVYALLIGGCIGVFVIILLYFIRQNSVLLVVPFLSYFLAKYYIGEGIITTLVTGVVIGNFYRSSCSSILSGFAKYYPIFLALILFIFGMKFGETLLKIASVEFFLTALFFIFIINSAIISIIFLFVRMQWQSFLFCSLGNIPGVLAFALTILVFPPNQGFIPGILMLSFLLHVLYLPRLTKWYGDIFTGRDTCSKLEEHKPTIEMPY